jgi:selenocysteine lyase/cysteine desulfurase
MQISRGRMWLPLCWNNYRIQPASTRLSGCWKYRVNMKIVCVSENIVNPDIHLSSDPFKELQDRIVLALQTYSNVHRGSGFHSTVTTHLFEKAREIVLEYLGLKPDKYLVIFCTPARAEKLRKLLKPNSYKTLPDSEFGLNMGIRALAVKKNSLPEGIPFQPGGGTTRLYSKEWIVWAKAPDKFEAGTPAIVNIIAFATALRMIQKSEKEIFLKRSASVYSADEILYKDEWEGRSGQDLIHELRNTLIGKDILVPTAGGLKPFMNLDNSASTPTFLPVWKAFSDTLSQPVLVQQEIIQEVKSICSEVLGAPLTDYNVIFTSNTTESINLVAESLREDSGSDIEPAVLISLLEHSSNDLPWRKIPGYSVIRFPVDREGFWDFNELEKILDDYNRKELYGKKRIRLVAVSGASNVLGICNDLAETGRIVHQYGASLLVDAAQLVAHREVNMLLSGIDILAFSAHKVYAPFGTGLLVVKKGLSLIDYGSMERVKYSGEENAGGIAALGKALLLLHRIGFNVIREEEQALTRKVLLGIKQIPGLTVYGISEPDSPRIDHKIGVISISLKKMDSGSLAKKLALQRGIGVRYGCLCAHIIIKHLLNFTPAFEQFQRLIVLLFPKLKLPGFARVSFGIENTDAEVDILMEELKKIAGGKPSGEMSSFSRENGLTFTEPKEVQRQINDLVREITNKVYVFR